MTRRMVLGALVLADALVRAGDDVPAWVTQASGTSVPKYDAKVPAVVLLNEQRVSIDDSGKRTIVSRKALRVLTAEGRREARAFEDYVTRTGKVKELNAWVLATSGRVKHLGKDRVVDISLVNNDVYSDIRAKAIVAESDATVESVFAYEAISEDKSIFTQFEFQFQDRLPTVVSRFALTLPKGWRAESVSFNASAIRKSTEGEAQLWELRDLPFIASEPFGPTVRSVAPRIGVSFFPAGAAKNPGPSFAAWEDVAAFHISLAKEESPPPDRLVAKTKELTAGLTSEMAKIAAIGKFAQDIHYIAITMNAGRGGGYVPHRASEVFEKAYGDCKDKANLMRTMLAAAGIESYPVLIYSGDRTLVRPEWPSPHQFNHMIVAVKLSEPFDGAAVLQHPLLGRLLFFDPTEDRLPPGYLPWHEQDSYALVVAPKNSALVKVPAAAPALNRVERTADVRISGDGGATLRVEEQAFGETAALRKHTFTHTAAEAYRRELEEGLASSVGAAKVTNVQAASTGAASSFGRTVEYSCPRFAQLLQGRLLIVKALPYFAAELPFSDPTRTLPVILQPKILSDTIRIAKPEGFEIDEIPDSKKLRTPFGSYVAAYSKDANGVLVKRSLEINSSTVPVEQYSDFRNFLAEAIADFQAAVVFAKK